MAGGLFALLDDVATLAKLAAASVDDVGAAAGRASAKAAGVVVDDTAVTPQYVQGVAAERELPIIRKIAVGSLRNKLLIILPVALLLSELLPSLLKVILMVGGAYLCYEGAEKVWEKLGGGHGGGHGDAAEAEVATGDPAETEKALVSGAIRTDLILSAEIMVIALDEVASEGFWARAAILAVVAVVITVVVYGVVALIVKMDDVGLALAQRPGAAAQRVGEGMVRAMPRVLAVIGAVGTVAMLWVGGHIVLVGADDLGWHAPYDVVHHLEEAVHDATGVLGAITGWLTNTACSAVLGMVIGAVVVVLMHLVPRRSAH
jgi:predicted DNA repair protein MutK